MASIIRRARKHNKHKIEITQMIRKRSIALERSVKIFNWRAFNPFHDDNLALNSYADQETLTIFSGRSMMARL